MRIQHNIMAMNAYRNYNTNNNALSKNLEKLSSGYAINRAGDDAAGLAISEKMRAQITGLDTAQKNAQDGISLVQTAEGALTEVHDMLNRMYELANQSANGTYDEIDREQLQKEVVELKDEIDRIADSTNFNGINLLNGDQAAVTTPPGTNAIDPSQVTETDGTDATAATKAQITIKLDGTNPTGGVAITGGTTKIENLKALTVDGVALEKLFDLKIDGNDKDWTTNGTEVIGAGATITLTAKTAGNLKSEVLTDLEGITDTSSLEVVDGTAQGAGSNATRAEYEITFNFKDGSGKSLLADGMTFEIDGTVFEISTDGSVNNAGAELIDLKNLDLTLAADQKTAADAIKTAVSGKLTGCDFENVPATITGDKFTLKFKTQDKGSAKDLGEVRISSAAAGAIEATHVAAKDAGVGEAGSFAKLEYTDFDISKLAVGDKIKIGDVEIEIVEDADDDVNSGKLGITKAKNSQDLISAFQNQGYNAGKIDISGTTLTITGTTLGEDAANFKADSGALQFTPASAAASGSTLGGLTMQIGDTSDDYNKLNIVISDMHADKLGLDAIDISSQTGAQDAVDVIKKAINTVSDVRGGLGAKQNRLEHTINNLSVTEENIQNAESSIRDTDVAEEMMAYTKNNILIQSAQAMLAQANQVPQGVLQLLG